MACGSWAPSPVEGTAALSGKLDQCRSLWKWQPSLASSSSCLLGPNLLLIHSGTHAITIGFINHPSSHKKRFFFLLVAVAGLSLRRRRQNFLILIYLQSSCLWFCDVRNVNVHCPCLVLVLYLTLFQCCSFRNNESEQPHGTAPSWMFHESILTEQPSFQNHFVAKIQPASCTQTPCFGIVDAA